MTIMNFFRSIERALIVGFGLVSVLECTWGQELAIPKPTYHLGAVDSSTPIQLVSTINGVSVRTKEHGWIYFGQDDEQDLRLREGASDDETAAFVPISPFGWVGNLVLSDEWEVRFQAYIDYVPWSEQLSESVVAFGLVGEAKNVGSSSAFFGDAQGLRIRETLLGDEIALLEPDGAMRAADLALGRSVAVTVTESAIARWDLEKKSIVNQIPIDQSEIGIPRFAKILANEERVLLHAPSHGVKILDLITGESVLDLSSGNQIVDVDVSWDRTLALLRREDSLVELWDLTAGTLVSELQFSEGLKDAVLEMSLDGPAEVYWTLTDGGVLEEHSIQDGKLLNRVDATETFFWAESVVLSPGAKLSHVSDAFTEESFIYNFEWDQRFPVASGKVSFLDDRQFILGGEGSVTLFSLGQTGLEEHWRREFPESVITQVIGDELEVVLREEDHRTRYILDPVTGMTVRQELIPASGGFNGEYESPFDNAENLGMKYRVLREKETNGFVEETLVGEFWDSREDAPIQVFLEEWNRRKVLSVFFDGSFRYVGPDFVEALSQDQRYLAYGAGAKCYVWDLKTGTLRLALEEPDRELDSVVFGGDGAMLAVSFRGNELAGRLRVWRLDDSDEIEVLDQDYDHRVEVRLPSGGIDVDYISRSSVEHAERNELFDATTGELLEEREGFWRPWLPHIRSVGSRDSFGSGLAIGMRVVDEESTGKLLRRTFQPEVRGDRGGRGTWLRELQGELQGNFRAVPGGGGIPLRDAGRVLIDHQYLDFYVGIGSSIGAWDLDSGSQLFRLELEIDDLPISSSNHLYLADPIQVSLDRKKLLVGFAQSSDRGDGMRSLEHSPVFFGVVDLVQPGIKWLPKLIDRSTVLVPPNLERLVFIDPEDESEFSVWDFQTESLEAELPALIRFATGSTAGFGRDRFRDIFSDAALSGDGSTLATVDNGGVRFWNLNALSPLPASKPPLALQRGDDGQLMLILDPESIRAGFVLQWRERIDQGEWMDVETDNSIEYVIDIESANSGFYRWKP